MSYTRTTWAAGETPLSAANFNNIEDGIEEAMASAAEALAVSSDMMKIIGNAFFPVGAIWICNSSTNPASIFGGTWEQIKDAYIVARGDSYGASGGSATASFTPSGTVGSTKLTAAQSGLPSHTHSFTRPTVSSSGAVTDGITGGNVTNGITGGSHTHEVLTEANDGSLTSSYPYGVTGSSAKAEYKTTKIKSATHKHDLPAHTHNLPAHTHTLTGGSVGTVAAAGASSGHTHTFTGTAGSVTVKPTYVGKYVWQRLTLASV